MGPHVFLAGGISGYVGGQLAKTISDKHPEYQLVALVRTSEQADAVQKQFPHIAIVQGDLDSSEILVEEASKADVVIRKSANFQPLKWRHDPCPLFYT
jgi:uncharacterized protein YbjT (DUF2867 family)